MKFLADEGIDEPIVAGLRTEGFDVLYIAELDPGIEDEVILERANFENRVLITQDKDFGELVYRLEQVHSGVILIRLHGLRPETKTEITITALKKAGDKIESAFVVIQPGAIRIRKKGEF
jgi:predicted nuclease of predicted toxin-antitoxin system